MDFFLLLLKFVIQCPIMSQMKTKLEKNALLTLLEFQNTDLFCTGKNYVNELQQHLSDSWHLHDLKTAQCKCLQSILRG